MIIADVDCTVWLIFDLQVKAILCFLSTYLAENLLSTVRAKARERLRETNRWILSYVLGDTSSVTDAV